VVTEARRQALAGTWHARLPFFYGWVIVGLGFVSACFGIGLTWAASIFAVPMQQDLGWSRSAIFFAISLRGWMGIVVAPLVGGLLDRRHGARLLALTGGLLSCVTLALIASVDSAWQFGLLFGVLGGVAQTAQSGISVAIVPKWFIRQRGLAVSLSTMGGGVAAFIMPPLIAALNEAYGWRTGWVVVAGLAFVFATLPMVLLRRQPEDVGLLPDGATTPPASAGSTGRTAADDSFTLQEALHTSAFWLLMIGVSIGSLASNGVPSNLTGIMVDRGLPFELAASGLVAYGIASIFAKVVWGWVANRLPIRTTLLLLTAYGIVALPAILIMPAGLGTAALGYGLLVGFFIGAFIPLHQLVWVSYFGRAHVGAISGFGRPLGIALISGGPFLLAFTRDLSGSYATGILITTAAVLVCAVCLYLVRPPRRAPRPGPAEPAPAATGS
jgi:sugar phosphate permease